MRNALFYVFAVIVFSNAVTLAQAADSVGRKLSAQEKELVQICTDLYRSYDEYYSAADEIEDEIEKQKYFDENDPSEEYVQRLIGFEKVHHGTHAGLMAARRLVLLAAGGGAVGNPRDVGRRYALTVLGDYADHVELPEIIRYLMNSGNVEPMSERFLRELIASPKTSVQNVVFAKYVLANWSLTMRIARVYREGRLQELKEGSELRYPGEHQYLIESLAVALQPERIIELESEALQILIELAQSKSLVRQPGVSGIDERWYLIKHDDKKTEGMPLVADLAAGLLFREQHLEVGKPAPDLKVKLVSGEDWSLAQQRGKTVVLQFSFKGCGPCEAMYPDFRSLAEEYEGKLTIFSLMADEEQQTTVDAIESGKLTWNIHWDGYRGPIATKWAVQSFPTIYIIAPDGSVAAKSLRGKQLRSKIAELAQ